MGGHKKTTGSEKADFQMDNSTWISSDAPVNVERKKSSRNVTSVVGLLPSLASTVLSSTVSMLRENAAIQSISKRLSRR